MLHLSAGADLAPECWALLISGIFFLPDSSGTVHGCLDFRWFFQPQNVSYLPHKTIWCNWAHRLNDRPLINPAPDFVLCTYTECKGVHSPTPPQIHYMTTCCQGIQASFPAYLGRFLAINCISILSGIRCVSAWGAASNQMMWGKCFTSLLKKQNQLVGFGRPEFLFSTYCLHLFQPTHFWFDTSSSVA